MTTEHKIIGGVVLLTVVLITGGAGLADKSGREDRERLDKSPMGEKIADLGAQHVKEGESHEPYNSNPPTSGPHWVGVAGPGIKKDPVPHELVLPILEHRA